MFAVRATKCDERSKPRLCKAPKSARAVRGSISLRKLFLVFLAAALAAYVVRVTFRGTLEGRVSRTEPAGTESRSADPELPPRGISAPSGTVWIPGGEFTMGSDDPLARP